MPCNNFHGWDRLESLQVTKSPEVHHTIILAVGKTEEAAKALLDGSGCDTAIEAAGAGPPKMFETCQDILAPEGTITNVKRLRVSRMFGPKTSTRLPTSTSTDADVF